MDSNFGVGTVGRVLSIMAADSWHLYLKTVSRLGKGSSNRGMVMRMVTGIAALVVLVIGIDLCVMMTAQGNITFRLWPFAGSVVFPLAWAVVLGALIGASVIIFVTARRFDVSVDAETSAESRAVDARSWLILMSGVSVAATAGLLLIIGVRLEKIDPATAAMVYLLGWLAAIATLHALGALARGDGIAFDSYWGGLGGAQGGWRISPVTTSVLLALVLVAGTVAVATGKGPSQTVGADQKGTDNPSDADEGATGKAAVGNSE